MTTADRRIGATTIGLLAVALVVMPLSPSLAAPPAVYVDETDDGVPPSAPIVIPPGVATTLYLYIDGGSNPSPDIRCAQGTGDEICAWDLALQGQNGLSISGFTPQASIVFYLAGSTLGIVGGDPWWGTLGPQKLGEISVQGIDGGTLELLPSQSVNASLGLESIAQNTLVSVPEPGFVPSLVCGGALLAWLTRRRRRRGRAGSATEEGSIGDRVPVVWRERMRVRPRTLPPGFLLLFSLLSATGVSTPVWGQVSTDCGDVVSDGVIDIADLDTLRVFLAGDPGAPDLQNDPQGLARCDVSGNGLCEIGDYARIRRYMLGLVGGMDQTCPLSGTVYAPAVLPPPTVDQPTTIDTDRASVVLSGTADPEDIIVVGGTLGLPRVTTRPDGTWQVEVPLALGEANALAVFRNHGAGYVSEKVLLTVNQSPSTGPASIEGRVVNALDGQPVPGAQIDMYGVTHAADSLGKFSIRDVPAGKVVLRIAEPGFVPELALTWAGEYVVPVGAVLPEPLVIRLTPRSTPVTVGTAGGTVTSVSGIELEIPSGSLAGDTEISLTELGSAASGLPYGQLSLVDIGPGPIGFDPPATLRIPNTSVEPGTVIDFEQLNQQTGETTHLTGVVSAGGDIEVPISASNGDDPQISLRSRNFHVLEDFSVVEEIVVPGNCEYHRLGVVGVFPTVEFTPTTLLGLGFVKLPGHMLLSRAGALGFDASSVEIGVLPGGDIDPFEVSHVTVSYDRSSYEKELYLTVYPAGGGVGRNVTLGIVRISAAIPSITVLGEERAPNGACGCYTPAGCSGPESQSLAFGAAPAATCEAICEGPMGAGWGEPHLIRFDHVGAAIDQSHGDGRFNFQAAGEFVLFESITDDVVVQARLEAANSSTTKITAVAMDVDGDRVSIYSGPTLDVRIEGVPTPLTVGIPVALSGGGELERETTAAGRDSVWVRWVDGSNLSVIQWVGAVAGANLYVFPALPGTRFAQVKGLLGNANGVLGDDLNLRDGSPADPAEIHSTYADSWRITQIESLFDYEPGEDTSTYNATPADDSFTVDDLDPAVKAAAEATCNAAGIFDDPWIDDCILDVAVFGDADSASVAGEVQTQFPDDEIRVTVSGKSNLWGAGLASVPNFGLGGLGELPPLVDLPPGTGRTLRFLDTAGTIKFGSAQPNCEPDGLPRAPNRVDQWGIWGGLTGPNSERWCMLYAVFLSDEERPAVPPPSYNCRNLQDKFIAAEVGQIVCPGDGLSAFNEPVSVLIPDDATRFYLGYLDTTVSDPNETPGFYHDNSGAHEVIIDISP